MTHFILIRHGETGWNQRGRFRGRTDIDLDETGVRQAEATGRRLSRYQVQVSAIYSSPLRRALRTAQIIASHTGRTVVPLESLMDIDFGSWQGLTLAEVESRYGEPYRLWVESPHLLRFPEGEGLGDVSSRVESAISMAATRHDGETVVFVTHRVVSKVMILHLLGLDNSHFWQIDQGACAINMFDVRDTVPIVTLLNDTCHLRGLALVPESIA